MTRRILVALFACCLMAASHAFVLPAKQQQRAFTRLYEKEEKNKVLDFLFNPYESKIPKELEAEIYRAEGNTPAAKDRTTRIAGYGIIALTLVGCAFFNGFLTELRSSEVMEDGMTLADLGFGWVQANFLFSFLFLNKIGGGLALISGAVSGMMAEAELDYRRKNAELIYEELERRRNASSDKQRKKDEPPPRRRKKSGKQAKRLSALSEVVLEEPTPAKAEVEEQPKEVAKENKEEDDGLMGKLKGWYDKADSMAASQALLLNKELEDKGLIDKITDESGLKVIGKEAAAELQKGKGEASPDKQTREKGRTD